MQITVRTFGMLARDKSKDSKAFTHIIWTEATDDRSARGVIEGVAKDADFILDDSRTYIVFEGPSRKRGYNPRIEPGVSSSKLSAQLKKQTADEEDREKQS